MFIFPPMLTEVDDVVSLFTRLTVDYSLPNVIMVLDEKMDSFYQYQKGVKAVALCCV